MNDVIDRVIEREGGFVDHPDDRGGPTKYGITQRTLSAYLGRQAAAADIRALTRETARDIYWNRFVKGNNLHLVDDPWLRELLIDATVLWGPDDTIPWLQEAAGVTADGVLGPVTARAVNTDESDDIGIRVVVSWIRRHGERVQESPDQIAFIEGWLRRATQHLLDWVGG